MMEQKIGIKIEGPSEERLPFIFGLILFITVIVVMLTMAFLLVEFLNIPIPQFWK